MRLKARIAAILLRSRFLTLIRWFRVHLIRQPSLTILCYHRVADKGALISPQCITPADFDLQLDFLSRNYLFVSPGELLDVIRTPGLLTRDAVAFTFDDGYQDNFQTAFPILQRYRAKAVFFVASIPLLQEQSYWIDRLSATLETIAVEKLPAILDIFPDIQKRIGKLKVSAPGHRSDLAKEIFAIANSMTEDDKSKLIDSLQKICAEARVRIAEVPLMSPEQLEQLVTEGHTLGGHTTTHPRLANLEIEQVAEEILIGLRQLRQRFGEISYFAYPFGKKNDLPKNLPNAFTVLHEAGVSLAFTTIDGAVRGDEHPYMIPRKVVSPQSIAQIALKLEIMAWQRLLPRKSPI